MRNPIKSYARKQLLRYQSRIVKREYEKQSFERFNERPVEFSFVFRKFAERYPKRILDVGTGKSALPHLLRNCGALVSASDNIRDYWTSDIVNRHYHLIDDDITHTKIEDKFDMVTCISVLEHIEKSDAAVRNMFGLLAPGGHLVMTFPYTEGEYVQNVYKLPGSSYGQDAKFITQSFSRARLDSWLKENDAEVVDQEYWQFWEGTHWTVGKQVIPPRKVRAIDKHQISCVDLRLRNR